MNKMNKEIKMTLREFDDLMFLANDMAQALGRLCTKYGVMSCPELNEWTKFLNKALNQVIHDTAAKSINPSERHR